MSDQTIALLLGTFGTIIAGFFKLINDQNKVHGKIAEGLTKLEESGKDQAEAMREVAAETKQGNKESAKRNGHLGEQNIQITKLITETRADMLNAVENVTEQHVDRQYVAKQVKEK